MQGLVLGTSGCVHCSLCMKILTLVSWLRLVCALFNAEHVFFGYYERETFFCDRLQQLRESDTVTDVVGVFVEALTKYFWTAADRRATIIATICFFETLTHLHDDVAPAMLESLRPSLATTQVRERGLERPAISIYVDIFRWALSLSVADNDEEAT